MQPEILNSVSRETLHRIKAFTELLTKWNRRINLVSARDIDMLWTRHVADSLQWLPYIQGCVRGIDLGSGAGFPGLLLSMASDMPFDLLEVDQRKCAFLYEAARLTGTPAKIHCSRIEKTVLTPAEVVTARALAPLDKLLGLARPFMTKTGKGLFAKGCNVETEISAAQVHWHFKLECERSDIESRATMLIIRDIHSIASLQ